MADHSDKLSRAWADLQPTTDDHVAVWLAVVDDYVSGAGPTAKAAWTSAKDAEVIGVLGDDSGWPSDRGAFDAKVLGRAPGHRLLRVQFSPAEVEAFTDAFDITDERVLRLIDAAVLAGRTQQD